MKIDKLKILRVVGKYGSLSIYEDFEEKCMVVCSESLEPSIKIDGNFVRIWPMINSWTMTGAVMINPYMTLKKFIKLQPRDMMNGAVYDEIYYALKRLDEYENGTRKSLELTDAPDTKVCDNCNKTYQKPVGKDVCPHCGY